MQNFFFPKNVCLRTKIDLRLKKKTKNFWANVWNCMISIFGVWRSTRVAYTVAFIDAESKKLLQKAKKVVLEHNLRDNFLNGCCNFSLAKR